MWTINVTELDRRTIHATAMANGESVGFGVAMSRLVDDETCRQSLIEVLQSCPYPSFRWETPPVSTSTRHRPFEFVMVNSPEIDLPSDKRDFEAHFNANVGRDVITFHNLGGDALLVVPVPLEPELNYSHLGSFTRYAPRTQQHQLWRAVGSSVATRLGERPLWLSTAGGGVPWLHVRLDSLPKYYVHRPYTTETH